jgi:hypothetical protein
MKTEEGTTQAASPVERELSLINQGAQVLMVIWVKSEQVLGPRVSSLREE